MGVDRRNGREETTGDRKNLPLELYVHIPFCVKKCRYCDFYSGPASREVQKTYLNTLMEEIRSCPFGGEEERHVTSVYFGGGTPSVLPAEDVAGILEALRKTFRFDSAPEITVEANPGTLSREKLETYRAFGVNRLSLGLQSSDDAILKRIGRIHSFEEFLTGFLAAREAGFTNVSVDLITGLPSDTPERFEKGLKTVLELRPEHLSVYSLILEENTEFYALFEAGKLDLTSEEEEREMMHRAVRVLREAGYRQYEISNFSLHGFESRHNLGYWTGVPYLGFGSAAASYYGGKRFRNASSLDYLGKPFEETEELTETDLMNEFLLLGLRMTQGVSDAEFQKRFGRSIMDFKGREIEELDREGLVSVRKTPGAGAVIALTSRGLDLANYVFRAFV